MTGATSRAPSGLRVYYLLFDLKREGARYFTARNSTGILLSFKFSSARPSTTFPGRQRGCTLFLLKCITTKPDEKGNRTEVPRIRWSVFRIFIRPHLKSNTCKHVTIYTLDFCVQTAERIPHGQTVACSYVTQLFISQGNALSRNL